MSVNFIGNFKVVGAILAIFIFMLIIYGYNKAEKRKLAKPVQQPITQEQQQAMAAYRHPSFAQAAKKGCGCGAKK
jgi:predicted lipid-binding transport protein (Tim44 family)